MGARVRGRLVGASLPKCNFDGAYEKSKSESTPWLPLPLLLPLLSVTRAGFVVVYVSSGQRRRQFARGQFSSFDSCLQCCPSVRVCADGQPPQRKLKMSSCREIRLASGLFISRSSVSFLHSTK